MNRISQDVKNTAINLRLKGISIKSISNELKLPISTTYSLLKNVVLTNELKDKIEQKTIEKRSNTIREKTKIRKKQLGFTSQTTKIDSKYNSKLTGDVSEIQIMATFISDGMKILKPFGDRFRYDIVVEEQEYFIRVQCKTAQFKGDCFIFPTSSNNWNSGKRTSYKGECDVFAVYLRENNKVYIFNVNNCPETLCNVRLLECHQKKLIRMAEYHEFQPGKSLLDYP